MAEGWILSVMKFGDAQFGIATRGSDYEKMLDAMATAPTKKSDLLPEAAKLLWEQSYEFGHQRVRIFGGQHAESKSNLESAFREHMGKIGFVEGTNRSNPESTGETFFINPRGGAYYFETEPEGKFMAYYAE
jgi:hypothetical protein